MKKFEYDDAEKLFVTKLGGEIANIDKHGFSREFMFYVMDVPHKVTWFHNQSYINIGNVQIMFFDAEISNTWPSPAGAKRKLQLRDVNGNVVAVIVLEWY